MYYESCVFYILEPLARGHKTYNSFQNTSYGMIDHLKFFLLHELTQNEQITRWKTFPWIEDGWHCDLIMLLSGTTLWHQIIGRTQLSDVELFRALQTQISKICVQCHLLHAKLKPHRKNGQIMTNNKHFTVENVRPPYLSTICTCGGSEVLQYLKLFYSKNSNHSSPVIFIWDLDLN